MNYQKNMFYKIFNKRNLILYTYIASCRNIFTIYDILINEFK